MLSLFLNLDLRCWANLPLIRSPMSFYLKKNSKSSPTIVIFSYFVHVRGSKQLFKREAKMAWYLLSPFLRVYGLRSCQGLESDKKVFGPSLALLTQQAWSVNDSYKYGVKNVIFLWGIGVIPTRQDKTILPVGWPNTAHDLVHLACSQR